MYTNVADSLCGNGITMYKREYMRVHEIERLWHSPGRGSGCQPSHRKCSREKSVSVPASVTQGASAGSTWVAPSLASLCTEILGLPPPASVSTRLRGGARGVRGLHLLGKDYD